MMHNLSAVLSGMDERRIRVLAVKQMISEYDSVIQDRELDQLVPGLRRKAMDAKGRAVRALEVLEAGTVPLDESAEEEEVLAVWIRLPAEAQARVIAHERGTEPWRELTEKQARDQWCKRFAGKDAYGKDLAWRWAHAERPFLGPPIARL